MKAPRSLRWQLQSYYFILLLVILTTLSFIATRWVIDVELNKYDSRLRSMVAPMLPMATGRVRYPDELFEKAPEIQTRVLVTRPRARTDGPSSENNRRSSGFGGRNKDGSAQGELLQSYLEQGWWFAAWKPNGDLLMSSRNYPGLPMPEMKLESTDDNVLRDHEGYRQHISRSPRTLLVIAYPRDQLDSEIGKLAFSIFGFNSIILILSSAIGWFLIGRALRPIKAIRDTAKDIASGKLKSRISSPEKASQEIMELSDDLNHTFHQLETIFERQARFTSDASHELRTPTAVILNHCQHGLAKDRDREEYRSTLHACQRAGERMKSLTDNLLELSKLESGEIQLERSACSIGEIAEEALDLVDPLASQKGVTLKLEAEDVTINANGDRIWQVIVNLLNNAIRHTPEGKSVTLRTRKSDQKVQISVIDEGEGIPSEELENLFSRFYRVDKSRARSQESGGFGLGLAICKTIIGAHGGTITAESEPSVSTNFTVTLPI